MKYIFLLLIAMMSMAFTTESPLPTDQFTTNDATACVCTAPFQRGWPYTGWWKQCYGAGDIWNERAECQTCFPDNGCGPIQGMVSNTSILSLKNEPIIASTSNDISKYQEAEVVACSCPQDWFWVSGWFGGHWVRQCFEYHGEDVWLVNFSDHSSSKPTYNPCN